LHLPSWFPGTYYANVARSHFKTIRKLYDVPLEFVQAGMKTKNYEKCFASEQLQELDDSGTEDPEAVDDIKGAAASIFSGGVDTTFAALQAFYLAMVHHPEYQKRAYEEIVSVVGENALPDLSNRESLPFVDAIAQEVFRWNTIGPIGIPHRAINDDIYNDMYIPKGAMVVANIRGMSLNENVYSNPKAFDPSRFLPQPQGKGEPPFPSGFGFGRRICPGRHFADIALWNAIACTLATLEILPVKRADGKLPEMVFSEALVRSLQSRRQRNDRLQFVFLELEREHILIDQPVGVGFSYAEYGESVSTTQEAAQDITAFVAIFFENFNQFKGRPFHMAGESYGGRYIPVFVSAVYDQNALLVEAGMTPVNLSSIMIGNGMPDFFEALWSRV
ncbi:hypothetical protein V5O48_006092, partial [Marasmius crinis-equi]